MVDKTQLILICLVAVALLAIVARKIRVPYPILLTIGGVGLALVPGLPAIQLDPQLVFNLFLPPLLYPAAVYTSWRDFRANLRQILPFAIGWLATQVQKRLDDPPVQTMFSLLTPYVAYYCGEKLHVSGILAVVIAGIYYGWRAPRILSGRMRLQALPVWEMVTFILNGVLFMLIGLQLPQVMNALAPGMATRVVELAMVVVLVIVLVRFVWMFCGNGLPRLLNRRARRQNLVPWQHTV